MPNEKTMSENDSYFVVRKWMTTELGLKGNERDAYAVIYSFCSEGGLFYGGRKYLADLLGIERLATVSEVLSRLVEKGMIERVSSDLGGTAYKIAFVPTVDGNDRTDSEKRSDPSKALNEDENENKVTDKIEMKSPDLQSPDLSLIPGRKKRGTESVPPRTENVPPRTENVPPRTESVPPRTENVPPRTENVLPPYGKRTHIINI